MSCLWAQDAVRVLPKNYRVVLENETVRVVHVRYEAHQKLPVHDHSRNPTVYIYLHDSGPVRFAHHEKRAFALVRPPQVAGMFRVSPGRLEKHEVENLGGVPVEFVRVELKQVPLGFQRAYFRSVKPFDLTRSGASSEFSSTAVGIERLIAVGGTGLGIGQEGRASLLVALAPSVVARDVELKVGEVLWMTGRNTLVRGHLLRVEFH